MFHDIQFLSGETCNWITFHKSNEPKSYILYFFFQDTEAKLINGMQGDLGSSEQRGKLPLLFICYLWGFGTSIGTKPVIIVSFIQWAKRDLNELKARQVSQRSSCIQTGCSLLPRGARQLEN